MLSYEKQLQSFRQELENIESSTSGDYVTVAKDARYLSKLNDRVMLTVYPGERISLTSPRKFLCEMQRVDWMIGSVWVDVEPTRGFSAYMGHRVS